VTEDYSRDKETNLFDAVKWIAISISASFIAKYIWGCV
jgi:hypothetical protein